MYAHVRQIVWLLKKGYPHGFLYQFKYEGKKTFVLQEGSFGHFVSLSINLTTARVKIIDSISSVSYAEDELRLFIYELYRTIMMTNKIEAQKNLTFEKVYIQRKYIFFC